MVDPYDKFLGRRVRIRWEDNAGYPGWHTVSELLDLAPAECISTGYLVLVGGDWILIASDCSESGLNGVGLVLRNCILDIQELPKE